MIARSFNAGQPVVITTVNRGLGPTASNQSSPPKVEVWHAIVVGPSVLGDDLWMVRKITKGRRQGGKNAVYTVAGAEIRTARR